MSNHDRSELRDSRSIGSHASWVDIAQLMGGRPLELFAVALGSWEQHGPHLPFNVDTVVADQVVCELSQLSRTMIGPALPYGASDEHRDFPGTVSIGQDALAGVLVAIGRSAARFCKKVLFVCGHGGNVDGLMRATIRLRREDIDAAWWLCITSGADAHAGHAETSMMLAICPSLVDASRFQQGNTDPIDELMPALRTHGLAPVSSNGVLGDPRGATATTGSELIAWHRRQLRMAATEWLVDKRGCLLRSHHAEKHANKAGLRRSSLENRPVHRP